MMHSSPTLPWRLVPSALPRPQRGERVAKYNRFLKLLVTLA
jgi:hypothetical protein